MKEIYKYALGTNSLLSDFTIGNSMRRFLEAYGTFVYKKKLIHALPMRRFWLFAKIIKTISDTICIG